MTALSDSSSTSLMHAESVEPEVALKYGLVLLTILFKFEAVAYLIPLYFKLRDVRLEGRSIRLLPPLILTALSCTTSFDNELSEGCSSPSLVRLSITLDHQLKSSLLLRKVLPRGCRVGSLHVDQSLSEFQVLNILSVLLIPHLTQHRAWSHQSSWSVSHSMSAGS